MEGYKTFFESKAVWGGIMAFLAGAATLYGYTFSGADQATVVNAITGAAATLGGLLAVYGRVTATTAIGTPPEA